MEVTYSDLQKMTLTKLKEYALTVGNIHGVHSMKKAQLIEAVCEVKGIVDPTKVAAEKKRLQAQKDIRKLKSTANELRADRESRRKDLSRKQLSEMRRQIKQLKRKTRKLARG